MVFKIISGNHMVYRPTDINKTIYPLSSKGGGGTKIRRLELLFLCTALLLKDINPPMKFQFYSSDISS